MITTAMYILAIYGGWIALGAIPLLLLIYIALK